ncbi:transposase, MuDR, MULE transposase domain protein [Tanacetum coccineum]
MQMEIMNRLPVKSLLQFRTISKSWKSYIDSTAFFFNYCVRKSVNDVFYLTYNHGRLGYMIYVDANLIHTPALANLHVSNLKPVGTSNGILCFSYGNNMMVCIANPSIGKKVGVSVPTSEPDGSKIILGFGVRLDNLDPTVLKFSYPSSGEGNCGDSYKHYLLVSFDMINHRFQEIAIPNLLMRVEAATADVMGHRVQVYMENSQSFQYVDIQGNVGSFFVVYEELEYRVLVPNDVNYSNLVRYVKKKFKLADGNQICLSYNIGSNHINIIDDDDVCYFVNEVSGQEVKKLYIKLGEPTIQKAWTGKQLALASTQGCPIESFAQLPFYCYNLKRENEGTVTDIDTDNEGRFKMCFIGFGVAIKSFLCSMRPLITIDAAHLKGTYLGTNLMVVGMDGNNHIIPIDIGVSQGKTGESWTWFLRKLKECIGEVPNLTIISDKHYAITLACNTVFPNSFHGYCCRHLMMNCGMQSDKYKELYWKTCKAYTV